VRSKQQIHIGGHSREREDRGAPEGAARVASTWWIDQPASRYPGQRVPYR
jgi:hypothetical protein